MIGTFGALARPTDLAIVNNRVAEKHRVKMENELKMQLEKYRLYEHTEQDGDPNIQARRQFFLELDYQRAKEGENIFREITKLSRVGTMRAKDRECTLRIVRQLVKSTFPRPSRQADIDWAIGYVHFRISQDTWTTAGLNWYQNAVQGWNLERHIEVLS